MSSPLDRIEARLASATRHGHGGNGSWVYRTSDVLALVNVAKAAEAIPPEIISMLPKVREALAALNEEPA